MKNSALQVFNENNEQNDFLDSMPVNIICCNLDMQIKYVNTKSLQTMKQIENLLPVKAEQMTGATLDRFHPELALQRRAFLDERSLPYKVQLKFGEEYVDLTATALYNDGKYDGFLLTWEIVSDKLNSDFVNQALDRSQAVIEFTPDGQIIKANKNFCAGLEYDLSEIKGKHHSIFCDPKYSQTDAYRQFWKKLNDGQFDAGQYPRVTKSGKVIWIQATYNPIIDSNGKVYKVVKYATDITKSKEAQIKQEAVLDETSNQLAAASEELSASADQMASNAIKVTEQSKTAAVSIESVDTGVRSVATNMEEMAASIREITRTTNEASSMASDTLKKANETNAIIKQLGLSSDDIGNVIKVISSIAQQTNLLALNATIEAARAGDAGRGFAVVANEVKELAKQTAKATADITKKIEAIQSDSKGAVKAIDEISARVEKVSGHAGNIAAAVEEQAATTTEISRIIVEASRSLGEVNGIVKSVSGISQSNLTDSTQFQDSSKDLNKLAVGIKNLLAKN